MAPAANFSSMKDKVVKIFKIYNMLQGLQNFGPPLSDSSLVEQYCNNIKVATKI